MSIKNKLNRLKPHLNHNKEKKEIREITPTKYKGSSL